jgi:putative transcriptional regulator
MAVYECYTFCNWPDIQEGHRDSNRKRLNHITMPIIVNLDVMMARRKMSLNELSGKVDLTLANLSILKTGKAKAVRFSTLEAICKALNCQPGDILEFVK